jgi:hypothetical protein
MPFEVWQPGMIMTEERLASISPTWQAWSPAWTTATGANLPSYGNAVVDCSYAVSATTCYARFDILFGSTTTFGSTDNWRFSLPVPAVAAMSAGGFAELNASLGARVMARARITTTTAFELEISSGKPDATAVTNFGIVDAVSPWTWASGHAIRGTLQYQTA